MQDFEQKPANDGRSFSRASVVTGLFFQAHRAGGTKRRAARAQIGGAEHTQHAAGALKPPCAAGNTLWLKRHAVDRGAQHLKCERLHLSEEDRVTTLGHPVVLDDERQRILGALDAENRDADASSQVSRRNAQCRVASITPRSVMVSPPTDTAYQVVTGTPVERGENCQLRTRPRHGPSNTRRLMPHFE
jgi:hypothetical protein